MDLIRWTGSGLPAGIDELLSEALQSGETWISTFESDWHARPFLEDGEALFLALKAQAPLAMAVLSADPFVDDPTVGRLRYIYVRKAARRHGIGEMLLGACLARARGYWRILRLHTENAVAARMYERRGFRPFAGDDRATHVLTLAPQDAMQGAEGS
jgi:hypothetical protein